MLTRVSYHHLKPAHFTPIVLQTRARSFKRRIPYPTMSTITDSEIISRLSKLSISHPDVLHHGPVKGGAEWRAEMEKIGRGDAILTKTVSASLFEKSEEL